MPLETGEVIEPLTIIESEDSVLGQVEVIQEAYYHDNTKKNRMIQVLETISGIFGIISIGKYKSGLYYNKRVS